MTTRSRGTPASSANGGPWVGRGNLGRDKKALAHDIIDYLARLEVTQGRLTGTPFRVQPWQQRIVKWVAHTRGEVIHSGRSS